jgi:hypothetical protein
MDNLVWSCSTALNQADKPACALEYGNKIVAVAFMKEGGTFTVATDYPTKAEFTTAIAARQITYFSGISNGTRAKQGGAEQSGDDTVSGLTEQQDGIYRVSGRVKQINEAVSRAFEELRRYDQLRAWFFMDKNYCFGGATGYKTKLNADLKLFEGQNVRPYIPFFFDFMDVGYDRAGYDADYDILVNP